MPFGSWHPNCSKDPTYPIFSKSRGFKDIKYDILTRPDQTDSLLWTFLNLQSCFSVNVYRIHNKHINSVWCKSFEASLVLSLRWGRRGQKRPCSSLQGLQCRPYTVHCTPYSALQCLRLAPEFALLAPMGLRLASKNIRLGWNIPKYSFRQPWFVQNFKRD